MEFQGMGTKKRENRKWRFRGWHWRKWKWFVPWCNIRKNGREGWYCQSWRSFDNQTVIQYIGNETAILAGEIDDYSSYFNEEDEVDDDQENLDNRNETQTISSLRREIRYSEGRQ
jgi:hypothetical protein